MSAPHTPGPWHVGEGKAEIIVYAPDGYAVADAQVFHFNHDRRGSGPANARLMAAAPEMLGRIKEAAAYLWRNDPSPEARVLTGAMYALIAKAEGRL